MRLEINNVSKLYKNNIWGAKNFSLNLENGILGLLGPNGAGKSTLMNILATITKPTEGAVFWNDKDISLYPNDLRKELGYLPQYFGIYPNLNAIEFLKYISILKGMNRNHTKKRIGELLELVNLVDVSKRLLGSYSQGMKQRIGIAQALLNDPKLLIVDEPTAGLDPEERIRFRNLLSDLSGSRIVILSTHIVSDVEATANNIAIIKKGELLCHESPEVLIQKAEGKVWMLTIKSDELLTFQKKHIVSGIIRRSEGILIRVISDVPPAINTQQTSPNLEDAYLYHISLSNNFSK
ncbi:MAG: ABC transporter ATP-binding protein [Bacteroidetes bacterium]|nr:ABC transporter ATP-binding protein [Bacteroidota bacterium]